LSQNIAFGALPEIAYKKVGGCSDEPLGGPFSQPPLLLKKTLLLACGPVFSLDACLLMGDPLVDLYLAPIGSLVDC